MEGGAAMPGVVDKAMLKGRPRGGAQSRAGKGEGSLMRGGGAQADQQ